MPQQYKVGTHATTIATSNGITRITYHNTIVVSFDERRIVLDSGGWETATTKTRMNQTSNQFDLGYQVYQKDFEWFVDFKGETFDFYDGIKLLRA